MSTDKAGLWSNTDAYEQYMGRWSQKIAPLFLHWLDAPKRKSWIDIGCGTGGLTSLIVDTCEPTSVTGVDTAEVFITIAQERVKGASFRVESAESLSLEDNSIDYAVSALLLNFVPDPQAAINEMARIVCPGGIVALYVWDYAGHMQIMRHFFDTAILYDPRAADYDDGKNAPICRPEPLMMTFASAKLQDISVKALDAPASFESFNDYWRPFLGGVGSAPKYCISLDESIRDKIKVALKDRLPTGPDGEILLAIRAWAVKGQVAN